MTPSMPRRQFIELSAVWLSTSVVGRALQPVCHPPLPGPVGINIVSFASQQRATDAASRIDLYDLPRLVSEELDIRILDLVSTMLNTRERAPLERFRARAEGAGCVITNLKVNLPKLRYDSEDDATRRHALDEYKRWIDAAVMLGARWLRPFPADAKPRWQTLVDSLAELADYAEPRGITLLVENYKWLDKEPNAIPRLVKALSGRVAGQPDTFNWVDDATRRAGLAAAFPHALSCDFKVRDLGPDYEHPAYDLRAAFEIGRKEGFAGPWCIEHLNRDKDALLRELKWIARQLRSWTAEMKA